MGPILVLILVCTIASGMSSAVASMDPALCPFELGYNPVFNADGSVLFCQKGEERFTVDSPDGFVAQSLRSIGENLLTLQVAAFEIDTETLNIYLDPEVLFYLQNGPPRGRFNPILDAFFMNPAIFSYVPGVDPSSLFDVTDYNFMGGTPASVSLHVKLTTATSFVDFDSVWRFNDVGNPSGTKLWQLYRAFDLTVTPRGGS